MENTKIIFLRHADTQKDPHISAVFWELSDKGAQQAEEIVKEQAMNSVDLIYVSEEQKTSLTAKPTASMLGKTMIVIPEFNEVKRGDKFLTKEEFEVEKNVSLKIYLIRHLMANQVMRRLKDLKRGLVK